METEAASTTTYWTGDVFGAVTLMPLSSGAINSSASPHQATSERIGSENSTAQAVMGMANMNACSGSASEDQLRPAWMPDDFEWYDG